MSLFRSKKLGFSALALTVLALAAAQGCSSGDDDNQATPTAGTSAGGASHGGSGGTSTGGTSTGGTSSGGSEEAGAGTAGGTAHAGASSGGSSSSGDAGAGGEAGTEIGMAGAGGAVDCDGPDGCYNCAPTTTTQFLNHCVEGGCQPAQDFHLPATLPALP